MKVKDLFKKVELTNEITRQFGDVYGVRVTSGDGGWEETFTSYYDFKKWVKEETNKPWADALLGAYELKEKDDLCYYIETLVDLIEVTVPFTPTFEVIRNE